LQQAHSLLEAMKPVDYRFIEARLISGDRVYVPGYNAPHRAFHRA
jgi:hypothetical protein